MTQFNAKILAQLYQVHQSTYHRYLQPYRKQLLALSTIRKTNAKTKVVCRYYNSRQLKFIIEQIMKDTPEGYVFNGKTFVKEVV